MSQSELPEFARCPRRWISLEREKATAAMRWGSLLDCVILTPDLFAESFAIEPEKYQPDKGEPKPWNYNANVCKEWRAAQQAAGREAVSPEDAAAAWKAADRFKADEILSRFVACSQKQVQVFVEYVHAETGITVPVCGMIDLLPDPESEFGNTIGDLKTTDSAEPHKWERTVANCGYHVQAALYLDAVNAATGRSYENFVHLVQEADAPFETARRALPDDYIELGRIQYRRALAQYAHCIASGVWPGYDDAGSANQRRLANGWRFVDPPSWMLNTQEFDS